MSTERLYYQDAYTTTFSANVLERLTEDGQPAVVIDRTCFYPTSGGQPHDLGQINDATVLNVYVRPEDQAVIHVISEPVETYEVKARIDWVRRFDHMQQHSGQHILSRAFLDVAGHETVSFHLSSDSCTIDLRKSVITENLLKQVEIAANRIVWEDRPITVLIVDRRDLESFALRSQPETIGSDIRLVNIDNYDLTPCGGTHVARTGEIGLIKIIRTEKSGKETRVHFVCGARALSDFRMKNRLVDRLTNEFTTSSEKIPDSISKLQSELKSQKQENRKLREQLAEFRAKELLRNGRRYKAVIIVNQSLEEVELADMRLLAGMITSSPKTYALLGSSEPRLQLVFGRSTDVPGKMDELLQQILADFETASGGGSITMAQGGGNKVKADLLAHALAKAEEIVIEQLND